MLDKVLCYIYVYHPLTRVQGLLYEDLMQESRLREFVENEYTWDSDSQHSKRSIGVHIICF